MEQQLDKRNRPIQKSRIWADTMKLNVAKILNVFSKKEPCGVNIKSDRIISTYDQEHQLHWGRYCSSLMDKMLDTSPSLSFRSGRDVSFQVGKITQSKYVCCTDFSRMDGNIGWVVRLLERTIIKKM